MHQNAFQMLKPRSADTGAVPLPTNGTSRPVDQLTLDGVLIRSWPSGMAAARELSQGSGSTARAYVSRISNCVRSVRPSFLGCLWRYADGKRA